VSEDWFGSLRGESAVDRERIQWALDALVRENRFTISVVFPVVGAVLLVASAEGYLPSVLGSSFGPLGFGDAGRTLGAWMEFNAALILFGTAVMRLPLIVGALPVLDRRAVLGVAGLTLYAYAIEVVGVTTGWPYGEFAYEIALGPMLFDKVPLGLPIFFLPLVLNSYLLCLLLLGDRARNPAIRLGATLAAVLSIDLVLDPGAVAVNFWEYLPPGGYYGVPASNYAGWVLSGTVAVVAFDLAFDRDALLDRLEDCEFMLDDMVSFVVLWGGINALYGQWVPVAIAAVLGAGLAWTDRFDFAVFGGRLARLGEGIRR
jgi:putative membrane protein